MDHARSVVQTGVTVGHGFPLRSLHGFLGDNLGRQDTVVLGPDWWRRDRAATKLPIRIGVAAPTPFKADTYYTPLEIAELTRFTRDTVYGWIGSNELAAVKVGRHYRVVGAAINDFLNRKAK